MKLHVGHTPTAHPLNFRQNDVSRAIYVDTFVPVTVIYEDWQYKNPYARPSLETLLQVKFIASFPEEGK